MLTDNDMHGMSFVLARHKADRNMGLHLQHTFHSGLLIDKERFCNRGFLSETFPIYREFRLRESRDKP